jgi:hypothetical protein
MLWLRGLAALALMCAVIPAGADTLRDSAVFGECLQQQVQPRAERISREVYRDDVWVTAPKPPKVRPDFPGVAPPAPTKTPTTLAPVTGT